MSKFAVASGRLIEISTFSGDDLSLDDIAHNLAKIQRYGGSTPIDITYSVGEHCVNLAKYALFKMENFDLAAYLLMHDASEAYLGDLVTGVKRMLPDYMALEAKVQGTIEDYYLKYTNRNDEIITSAKYLDSMILMDEVLAIMPEKGDIYAKELGYRSAKDATRIGCHISYNKKPSEVKAEFLAMACCLGLIGRQ